MIHGMKTVESGKKYTGRMEAYRERNSPLGVLEYELEFKFPLCEDKPEVEFPDGIARARFMFSLAVVKNGRPIELTEHEFYALCTFLVPRAIAEYNEPTDEARRKVLAAALHQKAMPASPFAFLAPKEQVELNSSGYPLMSFAQWLMLRDLF